MEAEKIVVIADMGDGQSAGAVDEPRAVSETEPAARGAQPMAIYRLRIRVEKNL